MGCGFRYGSGFVMRWKAFLLAGFLAPLSGCLIARDTARNLLNEPTELIDDKKIAHRLRHDSKVVWGQVCQQYPARTFSRDFVDGFSDGYVDYLESGGTAQPPAVPPIKYRRSRFMSVEGHARIQDYFCGFKYGCDIAAASGKRELITLPILLPEPPPETPVQARQLVPRITEQLPAPKPVDTGTGLPLLNRPLAISPAPMTSPLPTDAPSVDIPVIELPSSQPLAPPKFTAPTFDLPGPPRSELAPTGPVKRVSFTPGSAAAGPIPPLRELPNTVVKPLRDAPDGQPIPPWRGN